MTKKNILIFVTLSFSVHVFAMDDCLIVNNETAFVKIESLKSSTLVKSPYKKAYEAVQNAWHCFNTQNYRQAYKIAKKNSLYYMLALMYKDGLYVSKDIDKYWQMLNKAADKGDAYAQSDLGYYYIYGYSDFNITPDINKALYYLRKSEVQGNSLAKRLLGLCYMYGYGVAQDYYKSADLLKEAADMGDAIAQSQIGEYYLQGNGVQQNINEASRYIEMSATQGQPYAYKLKGDMYYYGLGVTEDNLQAAQWYQKAVDQNVTSACNQLAYMYLLGIGVEKNYNKCFTLYKQSADNGDARGIAGLGMCYENGIAVSADINVAVSYYKNAADQNDSFASDKLYRMYRSMYSTRDGVAEDADAAIKYLRKAVELGNTSSIYSLGYEYYVGEIIQADEQKASEYMKKAADEGDVFACAVLGTMYYSGDSGLFPKDYGKAFEYLSIAVTDPESLNEGLLADVYKKIGACYRFGRGTNKNISQASYYTELAAKYGDEGSVSAVRMMHK